MVSFFSGGRKEDGHSAEQVYQKQSTIFQNKNRVLLGETGKEKLPRYNKNIGLGNKTPKQAIEGTYVDKK
jgi:small subunit ribosomal protein S11e